MNTRSRQRRLLITCIALSATVAAQGASRLNSGTVQWAVAAKEGRADMLLFGDSIVAYGQGGWSNGIAQAAQRSVGLAGAGLQAPGYGFPFVWSTYTGARTWASGPYTSSLDAGVQSLTPSGNNYEVGTNFAFDGTGVDLVSLDLTQPMDWHVFANGRTPNSQLQAQRDRRTNSPWSSTILQTSAIRPVAQQSTGLTDYVFSFDGTDDPGDWNRFLFTPASRETSIYYTKLVHPGKTGMTVSGWSYSGGTTQTFRDLYYNDARFTADGRDALYQSLVAGNSGKLNVAITFGVNDAGTVSATEYEASIRGLIDDVRRDWTAAGLAPSDLSFTLLSAYQVNRETYSPARFDILESFRAVLDGIAAGDSQVSFIDMWEAGPTWTQAVANQYLDDRVHPSPLGTRTYGEVFMNQFMPDVGDADIDGDVDFDDLLSLAQHYGEPGASNWRSGDFDGVDGVAFPDLLALAQNYGLNASVSASDFESHWALARSLVPEPTALALFALSGAALRRRRPVRS